MYASVYCLRPSTLPKAYHTPNVTPLQFLMCQTSVVCPLIPFSPNTRTSSGRSVFTRISSPKWITTIHVQASTLSIGYVVTYIPSQLILSKVSLFVEQAHYPSILGNSILIEGVCW